MYRFQFLIILFCLAMGCSEDVIDAEDTTTAVVESEVIPNTLDQVKDDMTEDHVAIPRGVPETLDWREGPRAAWGNNPPDDWSAMTTWGQVYAAEGAGSPPNTRVHIRNMQTWYLSKATGEWIQWQRSDNVGGANYAEDFQNDVNVEADIREEAGGGYSATIRDGYNFHFWPDEGRVEMDPTDIEATWTGIDARLVLDDPDQADQRDGNSLMMSAGADYWLDRAAQWDQWKTNGDIAIGRFRYITNDWQRYNMHTATDSILDVNPPPFAD